VCSSLSVPIIADPERKVANQYGLMHPSHDEVYTVRTVFVIDPSKKIRLMITYPQTCGRNFDEILRVIDSMQLTDKHKVATPVNWKQARTSSSPRRHRRGGQAAVPGRREGPEAVPAPHAAAEVTAPARHAPADGPAREPARDPADV
jgi:alkyl hydroperoxide reductase subunit AhpC